MIGAVHSGTFDNPLVFVSKMLNIKKSVFNPRTRPKINCSFSNNNHPKNHNNYGYTPERAKICPAGKPDDGGWISRRNVALISRPPWRSTPQWPFSGPAAQNVRRAPAPKTYGTDRIDPTNFRQYTNISRSQKSFRSYLNKRYGLEILTYFRRLDEVKMKLISASEGLTFLYRCRDAKLRPAGLSLRDPCGSARSGKIIHAATDALLRERIEFHHRIKKQLILTVSNLEGKIQKQLDPLDWERVKRSSDNLADANRKMVRNIQKNKFERLLLSRINSIPVPEQSRTVVNRSKRDLSKYEKEVLGKGLNYAIAPKKLPIKEMVTGL